MFKAGRRLLPSAVTLTLALLGLAVPPLTGAAAAAEGDYTVTHDGGAYKATGSQSYTGSLKSVVESAVDDLRDGGGTISFTAGDFDLGADFFKLTDVHDITFAGAGMDSTVIHNDNSAEADSEPFNFSGAFGVTVKDMTVHAAGAPRTTSDVLDFDQGNDSTVENLRITGSRGRGIIFDGKNADWTSSGNRVSGCIIENLPSDGIELLGSTDNVIENCTITNVGGHGIQMAKSSATAAQANKPASKNTIRNNTVSGATSDGINVNGSDDNQILGNKVTNNGRDGIRVGSSDNAACDGNIVRDNVSNDNQDFGLNIASPLCHGTTYGGNSFTGNGRGDVQDLGTGSVQGGAGQPPATAPARVTMEDGLPRFTLARRLTAAWQSESALSMSEMRVRSVSYRQQQWSPRRSWTTTKTSASFRARPGRTYCLQVRGAGATGVMGAYSKATCSAVPLDDRDLARRGAWKRVTPKHAYLDTALRTRARGATLAKHVTGRHVSLLVTKVPSGGRVVVYKGDTVVRRISLSSETGRHQALVRIASQDKVRSGTYRIVVKSKGKTVIIDGLAVSRR